MTYLDRNLTLPSVRPLTRCEPVPISQMQAAWMYVGKAFQDGHRACEECNYCAHTSEPRPYGEGTAYEAMTECTLGQRASETPEMCPAYLAHLQEQAEETEE